MRTNPDGASAETPFWCTGRPTDGRTTGELRLGKPLRRRWGRDSSAEGLARGPRCSRRGRRDRCSRARDRAGHRVHRGDARGDHWCLDGEKQKRWGRSEDRSCRPAFGKGLRPPRADRGRLARPGWGCLARGAPRTALTAFVHVLSALAYRGGTVDDSAETSMRNSGVRPAARPQRQRVHTSRRSRAETGSL